MFAQTLSLAQFCVGGPDGFQILEGPSRLWRCAVVRFLNGQEAPIFGFVLTDVWTMHMMFSHSDMTHRIPKHSKIVIIQLSAHHMAALCRPSRSSHRTPTGTRGAAPGAACDLAPVPAPAPARSCWGPAEGAAAALLGVLPTPCTRPPRCGGPDWGRPFGRRRPRKFGCAAGHIAAGSMHVPTSGLGGGGGWEEEG